MPKTITLGLIQHPCERNPAVNLDTSLQGIRAAAKQGANLVLLQELHNTHYFCQQENVKNFDYAESIPGPTSNTLATLAAELEIVIVASLFERRSAGLYHNTAVVFDGKHGLVGSYRKMHIPDDPGYYEKFYFTPGDLGFEPVDTSLGRLGILICWDQWFPEAARLMAMADAELLLYPTAIGWDMRDPADEQARQRDAWITVQRAHAIANGLPVAVCNRTGFEPETPGEESSNEKGINFWGSSFIAGAQGEILAQASPSEAKVLVVEVDLSHSEDVRRTWPFLRDRRIDAYSDLLKRYRDQNNT